MPQIICKQCATLLYEVYQFIAEAQQVQRIYLQRSAIIKVEDCLAEAPIDLPPASLISDDNTVIKREPPELTGITLDVIENNRESVLHLEEEYGSNIFEEIRKNQSNQRSIDEIADSIEGESNGLM